MKTTDHHELLRAYAQEHSESAFQELVQRYVDLVYSAAIRRVSGDRELAEDVLPGQYTLTLSITAPPADPLADDAWLSPGPVLGATTRTVVVPPMSSERLDEPLDLGPIPRAHS